MLSAQLDSRFLTQVKKKIRPFLLRRRKLDVALQLPPKFEQLVYVEMSEVQREIYERWMRKTRQGLLKKVSLEGASAHRMQILEAILRLRQLCAHPWLIEEPGADIFASCAKYERLFADLAEVVAEGSKVLIYSQFTEALRLIERQIKELGYNYVYLDGSTKDRASIVQRFQEDPKVQIFLISLKAGGVGLNLTAADYVFLYDPWWNEAVEQQAIDRAHRVGKTSPVIARRYVTLLSIEEKIMHLKAHKKALSESLLDLGEEVGTAVKIEELLALLN
jgi:SNF2 family DNA or RNA helicase